MYTFCMSEEISPDFCFRNLVELKYAVLDVVMAYKTFQCCNKKHQTLETSRGEVVLPVCTN